MPIQLGASEVQLQVVEAQGNQMRRTREGNEADSGLLFRSNAETARKAKSDLDEWVRAISGKIELRSDFASVIEF